RTAGRTCAWSARSRGPRRRRGHRRGRAWSSGAIAGFTRRRQLGDLFVQRFDLLVECPDFLKHLGVGLLFDIGRNPYTITREVGKGRAGDQFLIRTDSLNQFRRFLMRVARGRDTERRDSGDGVDDRLFTPALSEG